MSPRSTNTGVQGRVRNTAPAVLLFALSAVAHAQTSRPNQLTAAERAAGWRLLFDGKTLAGWRGLGYDTVPTAHWRVVNGSIQMTSKPGAAAHAPQVQSEARRAVAS